jgi:iron complex transport system ATP-binding protein
MTSPALLAPPAGLGDDPAFRLRDLTLGYGSEPVIRGLHLDIPRGRTTVLIGANGCGKSTLLRALGRQLAPASGTIEVHGHDLAQTRRRGHARTVAFLPQSPLVPEGLTVAELVSRGRHPHRRWWGGGDDDEGAVADALDLTGTAGFAHRRVDELSGGQRQRVWLALVLAQSTPTLLLDEPCSFLDLAHQLDVLDLVRDLPLRPGHGEGRRTVVAVLHELSLAARVADHLVAVADGGVVAAGPPDEVITPDTLRRVFDLEADVIDDPATGHPVVLPRGRRKDTA